MIVAMPGRCSQVGSLLGGVEETPTSAGAVCCVKCSGASVVRLCRLHVFFGLLSWYLCVSASVCLSADLTIREPQASQGGNVDEASRVSLVLALQVSVSACAAFAWWDCRHP